MDSNQCHTCRDAVTPGADALVLWQGNDASAFGGGHRSCFCSIGCLAIWTQTDVAKSAELLANFETEVMEWRAVREKQIEALEARLFVVKRAAWVLLFFFVVGCVAAGIQYELCT